MDDWNIFFLSPGLDLFLTLINFKRDDKLNKSTDTDMVLHESN